MLPILSPIAKYLGVKNILCTERNINPADCYSYGDDLSDIPMLETTGHPVCVGKNTVLARHATTHSWPII